MLVCMRTTIRIDDNLLNEVKQTALASNTTLSAVVESALREMLHHRRRTVDRKPVELVTFRGRGLMPGVDLDDGAALLDLMERD